MYNNGFRLYNLLDIKHIKLLKNLSLQSYGQPSPHYFSEDRHIFHCYYSRSYCVRRLKNVSVKFIGLNPQDTSIKTKDNDVDYKLGPIEYSGLAADGSMVMGIAPFVPTATDITADPILSWPVPKGMSLEEASTVLVPYCMVNAFAAATAQTAPDSPGLQGVHFGGSQINLRNSSRAYIEFVWWI